jgi:A/G-specific adenine glycosylase
LRALKAHTNNKQFAAILLKWNREKNNRQMPWKGEKDPYKIWLSEIILQQTRVEQGLQYYRNFIKAFPDIQKLAKAPDKKVFKLWEGLGYYSRCKNLLATARYISKEREGVFPDTYDDIMRLKGVGPYTTAAISSFAFNLPHAVVDGNVFRVIARIFGINTATDTTEGKKLFTAFANSLLDKKQPGIYNQAIMDFGAVVCKPLAPLCNDCPFKRNCFAFQNNQVNNLPVKLKKIHIKKRWFYYFVLQFENEIAIQERIKKDIWQHLFEFYLSETSKEEEIKNVLKSNDLKKILRTLKFEIVSVSPLLKQQLSHQLIAGRFVHIRVAEKPVLNENTIWINKQKLKIYAFPKFIIQYLSDYFTEKK